MAGKGTHDFMADEGFVVRAAESIAWGVQWLGLLRQSLDIVEERGAEAVHEAIGEYIEPIRKAPDDLGGHLALCLLAGEVQERFQRHADGDGDLCLAYMSEQIVLGVVIGDLVSVEERRFWVEALSAFYKAA